MRNSPRPRQPAGHSSSIRTEARRLLEAAAQLPSNPRALDRGETYKMIFALLYGLGLRVGEVSRLCRKDVDFDAQLLIDSPDEIRKRPARAVWPTDGQSDNGLPGAGRVAVTGRLRPTARCSPSPNGNGRR